MEQYNILKKAIVKMKTSSDALEFIKKFNIEKEYEDILKSIIINNKYEIAFDDNQMIKHLNEIQKSKYKEDAYEIINNLLVHTNDIAQIKTFNRIANNKQSKPKYITIKDIKQRNNELYEYKECPHCGYKCKINKNTKYVICGYQNSGYDWEGCGRDWCAECNKILCKNWDNDQLFLFMNRYHDHKCCKKHAQINGNKYPDDYCRCNSSIILNAPACRNIARNSAY